MDFEAFSPEVHNKIYLNLLIIPGGVTSGNRRVNTHPHVADVWKTISNLARTNKQIHAEVRSISPEFFDKTKVWAALDMDDDKGNEKDMANIAQLIRASDTFLSRIPTRRQSKLRLALLVRAEYLELHCMDRLTFAWMFNPVPIGLETMFPIQLRALNTHSERKLSYVKDIMDVGFQIQKDQIAAGVHQVAVQNRKVYYVGQKSHPIRGRVLQYLIHKSRGRR